MVVVVEPQRLLGLFLFGIIKVHHRQRAMSQSHSSFLYLLISTISDNIDFGILGVISIFSRTVPGFMSGFFIQTFNLNRGTLQMDFNVQCFCFFHAAWQPMLPSFFVHISVHLFQKSTKINKNKNYKNLVKIGDYSFYLFLYFISFRWQGTFLSL